MLDRHPFIHYLCIVSVLIFAAWLRWPHSEIDHRAVYMDNDSLYQLQRIHDTLVNYPKVPTQDAKLHHPNGYQLHWPGLYPWLMASYVKLGFDAVDDSLAGIARKTGYLPIVWGLLACLFWMRASAQFLSSKETSIAIGLLIGCMPYTIAVSRYGILDHHGFVDLALSIMAYGCVCKRRWIQSIGLVMGLALTPEFPYYALILLAIWAWYQSYLSLGSKVGDWLPFALVMLVWTLNQVVQQGPWVWWDLYRLSLTHAALFAACSFAANLSRTIDWRKRMLPSLMFFGLTLLTVCLLVLWSNGQAAILVERLSQTGRMSIAEETSVLRWPLWNMPIWIWIYIPIAFIAAFNCVRALLRRATMDFVTSGLVLVTYIVALREIRHFAVLQGALISTGICLLIIGMRRIEHPIHITLKRSLALGLLCLALTAAYIGNRQYQRVRQSDYANWNPLVTEIPAWLAKNTSSHHAVMAPWDIGHQIRVLADRSVSLDPFNFPDPIDVIIEDVYLAKDEDELLQALERYQCKWLVAANPTSSIAAVLDPADTRWSNWFAGGTASNPVLRPQALENPMVRLWIAPSWLPQSLRLRTVAEKTVAIKFVGQPGTVSCPLYRIYEQVPGALVRVIDAKESFKLETIALSGGHEVICQPLIQSDDQNTWKVIYPAPYKGQGIQFPNAYRLWNESQEFEVVISEEDVVLGRLVEIRLSDLKPGKDQVPD